MRQLLENPGDHLSAYFSSRSDDLVGERAELASASLLDCIIESAPHPVVLVDCAMVIIAANSPARSLIGADALPAPVARVFGESAVDRMETLFSCPDAPRTASFPVTVSRPGGSADLHVMAHRLLDPAGRTIALQLLVSPTLWDAPRTAFCRPERVEALGLYAAGVVHEFNNLIAVISGRAGLGLMAQAPGAKDRALENVLTAARRAEHITKNLLTYVRRIEPDFARVDVLKPVAEALAMLEIEFARAHIEVVRRFDEVPMVMCDPVQISQVCFNILRNALDAMHAGGTVTVSVSRSGDWAVLRIADSGPGIAPDLQTRIFDPFVSYGRSQSCKPSGTGLGLFISKEIVLAHSGDISIDSTPNHGSSFTVRLPLLQPRPR